MRRWLICFLVCCGVGGHVFADEVTAEAFLSHDKLTPGLAFRVAVVMDIAKPWHANANPATLPELIPTKLSLAAADTIEWGRITYPAGASTIVAWADEPVALYAGRIVIVAEGRVKDGAPVGPVRIDGTLIVQACDDNVCLAPQKIPVETETEIAATGSAVKEINAELFPVTPVAVEATPPAENQIARTIAERGLWVAVVLVFLGGLALNLTPCVYPMIAITVSYFGGREGRTRGQALTGALIYSLGIVVTYTALGVVAALTGGLFGALLQSPVVLIGIAVLLVVLALSMFGLFEIQPPQFLVQRAAGMSARSGYVGVFLLGATIGIIAAPCLAPFVVALLAYVGTSREWWWFLVFSCGLALPYVILGTFSGLLSRLPKSGTWMVNVKRVFGVLMLAVAVWFVWPVIGPKDLGPSPIAWQKYAPELLTNPGQPVLIDFYADWCIPCREMDRSTLRDASVVEESKKFLMLKADLTRSGSPEVEKLTRDYGIVGVPTYAFFTAEGKELTQLRQIGFVRAHEFLKVMQDAQTATAPTNAPAKSDPMKEIPPELLRAF